MIERAQRLASIDGPCRPRDTLTQVARDTRYHQSRPRVHQRMIARCTGLTLENIEHQRSTLLRR